MADSRSSSALFQVYLRLRPPPANQHHPTVITAERFLSVEVPKADEEDATPTHITLNPPNDNRRRAVEKFGFTKVFEEEASQSDLFQGTGIIPLVEGVLGPRGNDGRDGLLATLGVTGSGKSHTILGSKTQRGLTQLSLDLLYRSLGPSLLDPTSNLSLQASLAASDPSEAQVLSIQGFLDALYGEQLGVSRGTSRAATPMRVRFPLTDIHPSSIGLYPQVRSCSGDTTDDSPKSIRVVRASPNRPVTPRAAKIPSYMSSTASQSITCKNAKYLFKGESIIPPTPIRRGGLLRPSAIPQLPDITSITVEPDSTAEYAIVISMYEVYNDRIFDLLTPGSKTASTKDFRRRPLLYKHTEHSTDRKVVAGLRKVICGSAKDALIVLEAGLQERRVAGTGSNSVSSRSHGFFCVEVKKRRKGRFVGPWGGSTLTIVDLAGSERARDAKTQGATLAEAGKINESLMYLGQCLQMQSDVGNAAKPSLVPFRQCKLTELLFSNSFPSSSSLSNSTTSGSVHHSHPHRNPQKAIMIVTADPLGDFNATSQILRYSALARDIVVPRIPSVTSTILASTPHSSHSYSRSYFGGRTTPSESDRETMEIAALEIARLTDDLDSLREELLAERQARLESEAHLASAEDRMLELEAEVREDCYIEFEARMRIDMQKWKVQWEIERERAEEHVDRKLEMLTRAVEAPDEDDKENFDYVRNDMGLEEENARLRREVQALQREVQGRSPSKRGRERSVLGEQNLHGSGYGMMRPGVEVEEMGREVEKMRLGSGNSMNGSPAKKVRKLPGKKWDIAAEDDLF